MFLADSDLKIDRSKKAQETIRRLDSLLSEFIGKKRYVHKKMTKGFLDYHGLNTKKFSWRFESMFDEKGELAEEYDELGISTVKPRVQNTFITPETFFDMEYQTIKHVQDKVDEYYNDIASRNYSVGVKTLPYAEIRYIFNNLLNKKFDTHIFKTELQKAQFDAAVKGTGFIRVNFHDKEQTFKSLKNTPLKTKTGVSLERIDPEDVFVDPGATDPKEMFIVSSYEVSELINKFPILKKKRLIQELNTHNILDENYDEETYIKKSWRRPRHVGETLLELYTLKDLEDERYAYLLGGIHEQNGIEQRGDRSQYTVFNNGFGSYFYNNFSNAWVGETPEERRKQQYEVVEYYDINRGLYIVYIDDIILYQGIEDGVTTEGEENKGIPEPFKDLPIVPIYMDNKHTNFYGEPLTEYFASTQDMITEADHNQRLSMLIKDTLIIDADQLNEDYHPNGQITMTQNAPFNTIHIKPELMDGKLQPAITPISFTGNSAVANQNRKNDLFNISERQFPSLKGIVASNAPEAQRDSMYSRDLRVNLIIKRQCHALSELAYKVFIAVIYELQYFSPDPKITIPMYEGASIERGFTIADNNKDLDKLKENKAKELEQLYLDQVNQKMEEYKQRPEILKPMIEQVKQEIQMKVIQSPTVQQLFPNGLGNTPEEQSASIQALLQNQQIVNAIRQTEASELENVVNTRLADMAKQEVQPIPDNNYYLSIESLNNYTKLIDLINFSFEKSRLERENEAMRFVNMMKPLEQFGGFTLNLEGIMKEIAIASGYDPELVIAKSVPPPAKMYELMNSRLQVSENLSLDKNPGLVAQMANDRLGTEKYTEESIIASQVAMAQAMQALKIEEITARNVTKAETNIVQGQAMEQIKAQIAQGQMAQNPQEPKPTGGVPV